MAALVRSLTAAVVISLGVSAAAWGIDRRIDGQRLVLKQAGTGTKLIFVSRDPDFAFPTIGGADDPGAVGASVELFSQSEGQASLAMPGGVGTPGWTTTSGATPAHHFRNSAAPGGISVVRMALLREGKTLKVVAKSAGLPLAVSQGAVGIRITTGTLRNCTRFTGATIRRDVAGSFVASHSSSNSLVSCSDGSMNGQPECGEGAFPSCGGTCPGGDMCVFGPGNTCECVPPSTPCGGTSPACGGTCASGEECVGVGPGFIPNCVCIPEGSTPCGNPGAPACGGACPSGTACKPVVAPPSFGAGLGCDCRPPGPCGTGAGADCGNGFACVIMPPAPSCLPISCNETATYPVCADGDPCRSGGVCQPFKVDSPGSFTTCLCAVPAPCDGACGGYTCPSGEVCTASSGACSCGAP